MRTRLSPVLIAASAGLALADAAVVALALPQLLSAFHTTVEGVAAVLGVYTIVLVAALLPAAALVGRVGASRLAAVGFGLFALASVGCALAGSLPVLLIARGAQALGGAAGLVAAFDLLHAAGPGRRVWLLVVVFGAAVGPALGGALTQGFDWRAIFVAQAPVAAAGALAALGTRGADAADAAGAADAVGSPDASHARGAPGVESAFALRPAVALGLVSAALTGVLFLLVLELVAGLGVSPLAGAVAVTVLPLAALASARLTAADAASRAAVGCLLVAAGTACLAFLPGPSLWWTVPPQLLAGAGMGLALPALAGDLLPERSVRDAGRLLTARHAGIVLALVVLAPIVSSQLDAATRVAQERGVALALDAQLPLQTKLGLGRTVAAGVGPVDPRGQIRRALIAARPTPNAPDRAVFDRLTAKADDTVVGAVEDAFRAVFLICGLLALLAAAALAPLVGWRRLVPAVAVLVAVPLYIGLHAAVAPASVQLRDPCQPRALPHQPGAAGALQDLALSALDRAACSFGSSREALVLALLDPAEAARYQREHNADLTPLLNALGRLLT